MAKSEYYIVVKDTQVGLEIIESTGISSVTDTGEAGRVQINLVTPAQTSESVQEGTGVARYKGTVTFMPEFSKIGKPNDVLEIYSHVDGRKVGQGVVMANGSIVADFQLNDETHMTISGDFA